MATIEVTIDGETITMQIGDRFADMHEDVNESLDRDLSLGRFAAQALRYSVTAIEQSIEKSIVDQYQAVQQAGDDEAALDTLSGTLAFDGGSEDA